MVIPETSDTAGHIGFIFPRYCLMAVLGKVLIWFPFLKTLFIFNCDKDSTFFLTCGYILRDVLSQYK